MIFFKDYLERNKKCVFASGEIDIFLSFYRKLLKLKTKKLLLMDFIKWYDWNNSSSLKNKDAYMVF